MNAKQTNQGLSAQHTKATAPRKEKVRQNGPLSGRFSRAEGTGRAPHPTPRTDNKQ